MKKYYKDKRLINKLENLNHKEDDYRALQNKLSDDYYKLEKEITGDNLDKSIIGKFFTFDAFDNTLRVYLIVGIEKTTISTVTFLFHFDKNEEIRLGTVNHYDLDIVDFLSKYNDCEYRESTKEEIELVLNNCKSRKIKKILKNYGCL